MALMQKEINELGSDSKQDISFYDISQNAGSRTVGWGIAIAGTIAACLFLIFSLVLKTGFAPGHNMGRGEPGYLIALWINDTFAYKPFPFSLILIGICILVMSTLCLKPCYGGKKSRIASLIVLISMIPLSVFLFINGANYKAFYSTYLFQGSVFRYHILIMASMLAAGISAAVFCCMEFIISLSINKLRSVFLAAATVLLGIVTDIFAILTVLDILGHKSYQIIGHLFLFGIPFLLLAIAQLLGCCFWYALHMPEPRRPV